MAQSANAITEDPRTRKSHTILLQDKIIIKWPDNRIQKIIALDASNISTLHTAPVYAKYAGYCAEINDDGAPTRVYDQLSSFKAEGEYSATTQESENEVPPNTVVDNGTLLELSEGLRERPIEVDIHDSMFNNVKMENFDKTGETYLSSAKPEDTLLQLHYKLGHVPMSHLKKIANQGLLPKCIEQAQTPICQACIFGKMTRRAWRNKLNTNNQPTRTATIPGETVSADQLESPAGGFIGQIKGRLTQRRYKVATIFVDHYTSLSYVHLQQSTSAEKTLKAKQAFELYAGTFGTKVQHYHADNGQFAETLGRKDTPKWTRRKKS
jgi:GAG-pre-integrase domain